MKICISVSLKFQLRIKICIQYHSFGVLGFEVFHIDLSRHGFKPVFHRTATFGHTDAFHPRPGHISKSIGSCRPAKIRHRLSEQLHIISRKSEKFDLFRTCGRVGVTYVDRRIGGETFPEIATSSPEKFRLIHFETYFSAGKSGNAVFLIYELKIIQFIPNNSVDGFLCLGSRTERYDNYSGK